MRLSDFRRTGFQQTFFYQFQFFQKCHFIICLLLGVYRLLLQGVGVFRRAQLMTGAKTILDFCFFAVMCFQKCGQILSDVPNPSRLVASPPQSCHSSTVQLATPSIPCIRCAPTRTTRKVRTVKGFMMVYRLLLYIALNVPKTNQDFLKKLELFEKL